MNIETISRRVLIVEDEGMVAMLLEDMLTDLGHEVVAIVGHMERATELVAEAEIDLAILDVNLNGQETFPLASTLMSRGVPFVFATGYDSTSLPESFQKTPVLQKPYQQRILERVLRETLSN